MANVIASLAAEFRRYKTLAEGAFNQLSLSELTETPPSGGNSVAVIGWHVAGNLTSRFTEFLTTDGEKPWRHRETEFAARSLTRDEFMEQWTKGWAVLFDALDHLSDASLDRPVTIRGRSMTVIEALHRSLAHVSYHVGQIVFQARARRGDAWRFLSIPPGQSEAYNRNPTLEKAPNDAADTEHQSGID